ncbi:DUF2723 domain-containing protein [Aquimarina sp. 2201CG5-10]|uniref:DUF2723 domain-containing protein n=1 Tax=Aquimarina callyspongiae TaxID=3098150 RepID=UPI002AB42EE1|nr:DUF2723 domain-containing protein [Aquimarina sp. 2201CG5-10]MDY8137877.1 DUF2723 domain-containing protein [Aquimarina sp. 2201CG5-10]
MSSDKNPFIRFQKWNKILGWLVFTIALSVYILTVEPTTSFWDVGEYIATSSKLQIGHPPGAPLFQMIGAVASNFTSNPKQIALTLNISSALASALTVLFMFWSITMLLLKTFKEREKIKKNDAIIILSSSLIGSLSFAFTDSFWFNAVEAEVYALATCVLSVLFYLGLLWDRDMHKSRGNKWLILISFITGLSFGIHFMGLLSIPAIGLIYYFKNYKKITVKNFILANISAVIVLLFIFKLLLPSILKFFGASEIFFINTFGLPFNSGSIIAGLIIILFFYLVLTHTRKKGFVLLHTSLLCILFILIGFSSWIMIPIRANAGTVINENNPNNARELLAYYNLEQYPENPLLYGPQFTEVYSHLDKNNPYKDGVPKYEKDEKTGTYIIVNNWKNSRQNLDDYHKVFLPRMWSAEHIKNYMIFTGPIKFTIKPQHKDKKQLLDAVTKFRKDYALGKLNNNDYHKFLQSFGNYLDVQKPSLLDNLKYLFKYQIGYMYWRYFMWNFVGRQNDIQGKMTKLEGNWLSGITFIDEIHLGSQNNLPIDVLKNKGRNTYFFFPLLLGLFGFVFHLKKERKSFWVLLVFFAFTGIALKIYLNEKPFEVRERDYALVGSFYVFAIWIGYGVYALYESLKNVFKPRLLIISTITISLLLVPLRLLSQNWDDHDRSNRFTAQSMAKNYLSSCQKDAILFTIGDNDTFPLWYLQEIEGFRTDVRTIIGTYLSTDWYTDQMKRAAYDSKPIPSQLTHDFYKYGNNDIIHFQEITKDTLSIKKWMQWVESDDPRTQGNLLSGEKVNTFPSKHIRIPVDKETVLKNGIVAQKDADKIVPYIDIHIKKDYLIKNQLIMLDIIANNNWERPIYFSGGSFSDEDYAWTKDYLQLDGLIYKLVPILTKIDPKNPYEMGRINTDITFPIVKDWDWGNGEDPDIYRDPETRRNSISYRNNLGRLATALIDEGKMHKAEEILDLGMQKMPVEYYEFYSTLSSFIDGYYRIGKPEKAHNLWKKVTRKYQEQLIYYGNLNLGEQYEHIEEIIINIEYYKNLVDLLVIHEDEALLDKKIEEFNNHLKLFTSLYSEEEQYDKEELTPLKD